MTSKEYISDKIFIGIAEQIARFSKCVSYQVGCVITKNARILSTGYNGTPAGYKNCNELFDKVFSRDDHHEFSNMYEIHAELNAIIYAAKAGISIDGGTMYTTVQPCLQCNKNIIQAGIRRVVFGKLYDKNKDADALTKFLNDNGIEVVHLI